MTPQTTEGIMFRSFTSFASPKTFNWGYKGTLSDCIEDIQNKQKVGRRPIVECMTGEGTRTSSVI
eukprot:1160090-Pelagomonas_calceolata.AAC.12